MSTRRKFIYSSALGSFGLLLAKKLVAAPASATALTAHAAATASPAAVPAIPAPVTGHPVVISTWDTGLAANKGAWEVLGKGGKALDAVEAGVRVTESSLNCCVGLGANPDRDGYVTLDACIMDDQG